MTTREAALTMKRKTPRASRSLVERFLQASTGNICDAQGRTGALDYRIRPIGAATRLGGTALTVDAGPRDNLAAWAALELVRPGDVLVISTGGHLDCSVLGDLYVGSARNAGVVGIVTDGVVRDRPGIDAVGIPVFARGTSPNSPWKNGPGRVGLPIVVGAVAVDAGDIVIGDQDGVVVVPRQVAEGVARQLEAVLEKEKEMEAAVQAGQTVPAWLQEAYASRGVAYLD